MWPHSLVIGINGVAVCVGTDDPGLVEYLGKWRVDEPSSLSDFGLELYPAQPSERSAPRILPNLKYGSDVLVRGTDGDLLRAALLRMITAATTPAPVGLLRLSGALLVREGRGVIVPEGNLRTMSLRVLTRAGFTLFAAQTVLVDTRRLEVQLDQLLGSDEAPQRFPLAGIWLNHRDPAAPTTWGEDVARLLGHCVLDGVDTSVPAGGVLSATMVNDVAHLVGSIGVRYVAFGRQALENELTALFGR